MSTNLIICRHCGTGNVDYWRWEWGYRTGYMCIKCGARLIVPWDDINTHWMYKRVKGNHIKPVRAPIDRTARYAKAHGWRGRKGARKERRRNRG